jgi:quercetin dioxygenase-like cupin family protein
MDYKANKATPLRPEGDRTLNAALVEIDFEKFIQQLKEESTWQDSDKNSITVFKSDHKTIVIVGMHPDAEMQMHTSSGEITLQVLVGAIKFTAHEQTLPLKPGKMFALQAEIPHSVKADDESFFLLTLENNKPVVE